MCWANLSPPLWILNTSRFGLPVAGARTNSEKWDLSCMYLRRFYKYQEVYTLFSRSGLECPSRSESKVLHTWSWSSRGVKSDRIFQGLLYAYWLCRNPNLSLHMKWPIVHVGLSDARGKRGEKVPGVCNGMCLWVSFYTLRFPLPH